MPALSAAVALVVALCAARIGLAVLRRIVPRQPLAAPFVSAGATPGTALAALLAAGSVLHAAPDSLNGISVLRHLATVAIIAAATWLAMRLAAAIESAVALRYPANVVDNLEARRIQTQTRVLSRTLASVIGVLGVSFALLTFPQVRTVGAGLLASAGVAGLAVGLAAKPILGNLLAGLQIAFTQPIRLDDVVIVEGEWGRIEEIGRAFVALPGARGAHRLPARAPSRIAAAAARRGREPRLAAGAGVRHVGRLRARGDARLLQVVRCGRLRGLRMLGAVAAHDAVLRLRERLLRVLVRGLIVLGLLVRLRLFLGRRRRQSGGGGAREEARGKGEQESIHRLHDELSPDRPMLGSAHAIAYPMIGQLTVAVRGKCPSLRALRSMRCGTSRGFRRLSDRMLRKIFSMGAVAVAALSLGSAALAQQPPRSAIRWTGPAEPECIYKAVMSDAEIRACTRHAVRYDYRVLSEGKVAGAR
ncbi:MAG TPA: mechanosensitive ion channel domain-containing protein [Burkholderiales bacterium]|nr:mechanosensitive ion channel domain-containing protein [Burkholderiales bacterium]